MKSVARETSARSWQLQSVRECVWALAVGRQRVAVQCSSNMLQHNFTAFLL